MAIKDLLGKHGFFSEPTQVVAKYTSDELYNLARQAFVEAFQVGNLEKFKQAINFTKEASSEGNSAARDFFIDKVMHELGFGTRIVTPEMRQDHSVICQLFDMATRRFETRLLTAPVPLNLDTPVTDSKYSINNSVRGG